MKFFLSSEILTWNWSHSPQLAWISAQLLFFRFPLPFHLRQPLWTLYHTTSNLNAPHDINNQFTASFSNTNTVVRNSIPFSAVYPEIEDEPLGPTNTSRQNVRPLAPRPRHSNSQHHAKSVTLYKQHRREQFAYRARVVKKPRFNRHWPYKLKPEISSWEKQYWDSTRQEFTIRNNSTISRKCRVLKSNHSSAPSMTLNPFAPTFRPQKRPKPYSFSRPQPLVPMDSSEPSDFPAELAKASTASSSSSQIEKQIPLLSAQLNQLHTYFESSIQQFTTLLQQFALAPLKQVQYLHSVQLTVAQLHQNLES